MLVQGLEYCSWIRLKKTDPGHDATCLPPAHGGRNSSTVTKYFVRTLHSLNPHTDSGVAF